MPAEEQSQKLREDIHGYEKEYWKIKGRIEELNDREEELKQELERVRNHLSYYTSLVSDMKKKMQGRKTSEVFERL